MHSRELEARNAAGGAVERRQLTAKRWSGSRPRHKKHHRRAGDLSRPEMLHIPGFTVEFREGHGFTAGLADALQWPAPHAEHDGAVRHPRRPMHRRGEARQWHRRPPENRDLFHRRPIARVHESDPLIVG